MVAWKINFTTAIVGQLPARVHQIQNSWGGSGFSKNYKALGYLLQKCTQETEV